MKSEAEIRLLFVSKLDKDEEILLMGNFPHKNSGYIMQDRKSAIGFAIFIIIFFFTIINLRLAAREELTAAIQFAFCIIVPATIVSLVTPIRRPRVRQIACYAVTTKRFFIYETGDFNSYSLYKFTDFVVSKAKDGFSDVSLYTESTVSGNLAKPLFQLKNLYEAEAQKVYKTLMEAREEALEARAREMGIE